MGAAVSHFGLLLAWGSPGSVAPRDIGFWRSVLSQGAVYVSTWGLGAEQVHDAIDLARDESPGATDDDVVITTWHEREDIAETLGFVLRTAQPTAGYADGCRSWVIAAIGEGGFRSDLRQRLIELEEAFAPLFVTEGDDMAIFATLWDAEHQLEAIDVREGIYDGYDARGRRLHLSADDPGARIRLSDEEAAGELEEKLRRHLSFLGDGRATDASCDLPCLADRSWRYVWEPFSWREFMGSLLRRLGGGRSKGRSERQRRR